MLSPFRGFMDVQGEMNRMLEEMLGGISRSSGRQRVEAASWSPAIDVFSQDGDVVIRAELPGVKQEDVDVTLQDGMLLISGEHRVEQEEQSGGYYVRERRHGAFRRSVALPEGITESDIHARFEDGVLEVKVEGAAAIREPRRIQIEGPSENGE